MSDRRPLSHVLYTNAPGEDGEGFRPLAVGFQGTQMERQEIESWLMGLKLADDQRIGWATNSFEVNRSPWFALAMVDSTRFPLDEISRAGGILAHALLILIEERRPVGDFGHAVFDKAKEFLDERSGSPALGTYLQGCRVINDLEIPELQCNNFRGLDPQFLEIFFSAAYDGGRGAPVLFPGYTSDDQLPEDLLTASAVLPPRLRLNMSWRVGLQASKEGFVARVASGPATLPAENLGTAYLAAVRAQLDAGQDDQVARFASSYWGVNSWSGLQQAFNQPEEETDREIGSSGSLPQLEESDMAKKGTATGSKSTAAPQAKSQTTFDEEYQALERDLRDYLDEQLILLGAQPATRSRPPYSPRGSSGGDRHPALRWYREWRPEVYFLILLLLGSVAFWKLRPPTGDEKSVNNPQPTASPSSTPFGSQEPEPRPTPAATTVSVADWTVFVEKPEAIGWFQAVAEARGLAASQVSGLRKNDFNGWMDKLKKQERLTDTELVSSRICFFEYVHARWAKERKLGDPARDVVTLDPAEVAPRLKQMVTELGLTGTLGSNPDVKDEKVQAAVSLAWIQQHSSP